VADKTLSQQEIDALLNTLVTEQEPVRLDKRDPKIRTYDFRVPPRLSGDQMYTLRNIFGEFARQTDSVLAILLRTQITVRLAYFEQTASEGLTKTLGITPPMAVIVLRMPPLPGRALLIFAGHLVWSLVERVLGAPSTTLQAKEREITDIEMSLMEEIIQHILKGLQVAWDKVIHITPVLEASSVDVDLMQTGFIGEFVLAAMLEINIGEVTGGAMAFLMPVAMLNPIASLLESHLLTRQHEEEETEPLDIEHSPLLARLQKAPLPLSVLLGEAEVGFRDLMQLQPGDVIRLNRAIDEEMEVRICGRPRFMSQPGLKGSSLAVRVTRPVEPS